MACYSGFTERLHPIAFERLAVLVELVRDNRLPAFVYVNVLHDLLARLLQPSA